MQGRIDTERLILEFDITNEELANAANITLYTASRVLSAWQRTDERKSVLANAPTGQLGIAGESKLGGSCHFFGNICTLFAFPGILVLNASCARGSQESSATASAESPGSVWRGFSHAAERLRF